MKISLFISGLGNGGAERVFLRLLKHFADSGHDVELVSATNKGSLKHDINPNIKYLGAGYGYLSCFKYYQYLKNRNPDIVIATLSSSIFTASFVKFFLAKRAHKLICRIANVYQEPTSYFASIALLLQRFSLKNCDAIIFNSNATMKSTTSLVIENFSNIETVIINNPVLDDDYQAKKKLLRDGSFDAENKSKTILFIGRLVPQKRVGHAIKIFAMVAKKIPDCKLLIVGDGPEKNKVLELIKEHKVSDKVSIVSYCDNVPKLLVESHCIINTSKFEGFGNVFIEGLAYCDNLVSYKSVGGASELLPLTNATLILDGDIEGMSKAVTGVFMQEKNVKLATKDYLETFTTSYVGDKYLEFSTKVTNK